MSLEPALAAWQSPWLYGPAATVLGLAVGSFLNVVVHRLPLMMERDWTEDIRTYFEDHKPSLPAKAARDLGAALGPDEPLSLVSPRSRCPACRHALSALENIPLLSFAWQRGRCRHCGHAISWRYPVIEALTAGLFLLALLALGPNWQGLTALAFIALLVPLAVIDLDHQLLPDSLSLGLLWLGLLVNLMGVHAALEDAVLGAALGYLSLRAVQLLFRALRGFEGMGGGDAKLLAALGAWSGWQLLPLIAFLAASIGVVVSLIALAATRRGAGERVAFGPYLALAGLAALLQGEALVGFVRDMVN